MERLTFTLTTRSRIICPVCTVEIQAQNLVWVRGIACCGKCGQQQYSHLVTRAVHFSRRYLDPDNWTWQHGLLMCTPTRWRIRRVRTELQEHTLRAIMHDPTYSELADHIHCYPPDRD